MSYIAGQLLHWERFWAPWDPNGGTADDKGDFLPDPTAVSWNTPSVSLKSTTDLVNFRCLVMLGDPGMGKTTCLENLVQAIRSSCGDADSIFEIHCRDVPDPSTFRDRTYGSRKWRAMRERGSDITLVVDGVDEGLRKIPEFVGALADALKDEALARLRVVLVCRTSEWDASAGERLLAMWPDPAQQCAIFELCRLRWRDVSMAAEASLGRRADIFMETVTRRGLEALAARPLTLKLLIEDFASRGELASNRRDLYLNAITRVAEEWDESRRRRLKGKVKDLPPLLIVTVAQRIAGLLLICGRSAVSASKASHQKNDLSIDEIAGEVGVPSMSDSETIESVQVTRDDVMEVLNCALFSTRGTMRFGFDHPTFGELLAAEFLASFELRQARRLLCVEFRNRECVVPQMAETAAWLALARTDWAEELLKIDPEVLLRTDVPFLPSDLKRRLVETLLDRASRLETLDHYEIYRRLRGIAHPGLEKQLRPWIEDETRQINARRMAIEMVGMAPVPQLESLLWGIVDTTGPKLGRSESVRALHNLAGKHSRKQLRRVLEGSIPAGPRFEVLSFALQAGVPEVWPVRTILSHLRKPGEDWIGGDYRMTVDYHLPGVMTHQDVVPVLKKLKEWRGCFGGLSPFSGLAYRALSMALASSSNPTVRKALASMWAHRVENHYSLPGVQFSEWQIQFSYRQSEQVLGKRENRRCLASILIEAREFGLDQIYTYGPRLLDVDDLGWALDKTKSAPSKFRKPWAAATLVLVQEAARVEAETPETRALTVYDAEVNAGVALRGVEVFVDKAMVLPKVGLTETCVRRERAQLLTWKRRFRHRDKSAPTSTEFVRAWLAGYRQHGKDVIWVEIGCHIYYKHDWCWDAMTATEVAIAKECARKFLLSHGDSKRPPNRFNNISIAAYEAILLLRVDAGGDASLKRTITKKWMFALHDILDNDEERHRDAITWAYRLAPEKMIEALLRALRHNDQTEGYGLAIQNFEGCWDGRLTRRVLAFLLTARTGSFVESCVGHLMKLDRGATEKWLLRRLTDIRRLGVKRTNSHGVILSILNGLSGTAWDKAWDVLHRSAASNRKSFLHQLSRRRHDQEDILQGKSATQLGCLFQEISELFKDDAGNEERSKAEEQTLDQDLSDESTEPAPDRPKHDSDSDISILQSGLGRRLAEMGTGEALSELERLQKDLPPQFLLLAYYIKDCVQRCLSILASERVPSPAGVLKLHRLATSCWVDSERDLFDATLSSIGRFQTALTAGTDLVASEHLWDRESPKKEDVFSKMLAGWIRKDLRGAIVNRETQVESVGGGRLDIKIQAMPRRHRTNETILTTVIEVKRDSHPKVQSALQTQLINGYMKREHIRHGIHLVAWFGYKSADSAKWQTPEEAQRAVDRWNSSASLPDGYSSACAVVDCRRSAIVPSKL